MQSRQIHRQDSPAAVAWIRSDGTYPHLHGRISFLPERSGTLVTAEICGLPASETGFFALHVHEGGDCTGAGFPNTGSHYNPRGAVHPDHAGDLPPLLRCGGKAYMTVLTDRFRVSEVIGKTVVIHARPDDFKTQPAGDAGTKIACGVIRRVP